VFLKKLAGWLLAGVLASGCAVGRSGYQGSQYGHGPAYGYDQRYRQNNPFYDELAPHGRWVNHPQYGTVFIPARSDFAPYTNGRWVYTDQGPTWVSNEPFGWATEHYGHWVRDPRMGWAWVPGDEWSPGRVEWYDTGSHIGWAPIGPDGRGYRDHHRYVPYDRFGQNDMHRHYVSGRDFNSRRIQGRPDHGWFQRHNMNVRPERVDSRRIDQGQQQREWQDAQRRQQDAHARQVEEQRQAADAMRRQQDEQRRQLQQQEVARQHEVERQRAEQQRQMEAAQRAQEAQQRAYEDAERRRNQALGVDDRAAAQLRRDA
jgi:hypothetical protein